jgi:acyl-CoA thioesterase FadM
MDVHDRGQWVVGLDRAIGQDADRPCAKCAFDTDFVGSDIGQIRFRNRADDLEQVGAALRQRISGQRLLWPQRERIAQFGVTNWTETYRGTVPPWQCDVTEHFTVAYYFDRLEEADANLADEPGVGDLPRPADDSRRIHARFAREIRAGASYHVESAPLSVEDGLHLGHRFVGSATGDVVTWFQEHWEVSASPLTSRHGTLDRDARRPARWPDDIRRRATAFVVPVG